MASATSQERCYNFYQLIGPGFGEELHAEMGPITLSEAGTEKLNSNTESLWWLRMYHNSSI